MRRVDWKDKFTFCSTNAQQYFRHEPLSVTMSNYEIDSFLSKFNALCQSGRSASLNLSSNAGKVAVNLRVDLGVLHEGPYHPFNPFQKWTA